MNIYCRSQQGRIDRIHKSKLNAQTTTTSSPPDVTEPPPSVTPPTPVGRCESISQIPACAQIGYKQAFFPSFRHQTPSEVNLELVNLKPLIDSNCSDYLLPLLCSVNAPLCYVDTNTRPNRVQTCVELCYFVKNSCEPVLRRYNLKWPSYLDCNNDRIYRVNDSQTFCPSSLNMTSGTMPTPTQTTPIEVSTLPAPVNVRLPSNTSNGM